ncbi:hypothetical protein [Methylovirgula sp. HY1]|uniref:hypothetical protein n=1 Tax=Methylovirgula sp. HY1 TaxID=2822761 RepID=UPI001C5B037B|nr:hypothetical protein [Methylovirgula sp. HY1]QXX73436.1 hypothetical protein MHY1_00232 [Methylovirgula sp. HY1]
MPTDLPIVRRPNVATRAARQSLVAAIVIAALPILLILLDAAIIGNGRISPSSLLRAWVADGSSCGSVDGRNCEATDPRP